MTFGLFDAQGIDAREAYLDHLSRHPRSPHDYRELEMLRRRGGGLSASEAALRTILRGSDFFHLASVSSSRDVYDDALVRVHSETARPDVPGLARAHRAMLIRWPEDRYLLTSYTKKVHYSGPNAGRWYWSFQLVELEDTEVSLERWNVVHQLL